MKKFKVELSWDEHHYGEVIIQAKNSEQLKEIVWGNYNDLRGIILETQDTFSGFSNNGIYETQEIEKNEEDNSNIPVVSIDKDGNIKSDHL